MMKNQLILLLIAATALEILSAPYVDLVPRYDRLTSNVVARRIDRPSLANLDYAAYNANPVLNATYYEISPYVDSTNQTDYGFGFTSPTAATTTATTVKYSLPDAVSGNGIHTIDGSAGACTPTNPCFNSSGSSSTTTACG